MAKITLTIEQLREVFCAVGELKPLHQFCIAIECLERALQSGELDERLEGPTKELLGVLKRAGKGGGA